MHLVTKIMKSIWPAGCIGLLMLPLAIWAGDDNWQQIRFHEVDTLFANPGQGWMSQRLPSSVVYLRFNWAEVEPEEGHYNWDCIEAAISACKPRGAAVAMRVMTANAHTRGYYCSPKWLFDLGCKGFEYTTGGDDPTSGGRRIPRIEPDYSDPVYLAKQGNFIAALGKRYDGKSNVEFVDIGSYGIWGEWHTTHPASIQVRRQIVDMYLHAFHTTPLVGMADDAEALAYTLAHGGGYRCDGIGCPGIQSRWSPEASGKNMYYPAATFEAMTEAWKQAPVVFEWYGDYDYLMSKGWSFDAAVEFMLTNHVTVINDNLGNVPLAAKSQLDKLSRLAGYRFVLRELQHEKAVRRGAELNVRMTWANVGVGKFYHAYELQLCLRDSAGQTVATTVANTDPRDWLPGDREIKTKLMISSNLPSGQYGLAISIADKTGQRPPLILAMDAPVTNGWYIVSQITIK